MKEQILNIISIMNRIGSDNPPNVEIGDGEFRIYISDNESFVDIHDLNNDLLVMGINEITIDDIDYDGDQGSTIHCRWTIGGR